MFEIIYELTMCFRSILCLCLCFMCELATMGFTSIFCTDLFDWHSISSWHAEAAREIAQTRSHSALPQTGSLTGLQTGSQTGSQSESQTGSRTGSQFQSQTGS